MSKPVNLTTPPADFEKFGRRVWEGLTTVKLSSGDPAATTHEAVKLAVLLSEADRTTAAHKAEAASMDAYLDQIGL